MAKAGYLEVAKLGVTVVKENWPRHLSSGSSFSLPLSRTHGHLSGAEGLVHPSRSSYVEALTPNWRDLVVRAVKS